MEQAPKEKETPRKRVKSTSKKTTSSSSKTKSSTKWSKKLTGIKHMKKLNDCPITSVTVYSDRAEVTRQFELKATEKGVQDVVIHGFAPTVNENSFRMSGGIGDAVILELSYEQVSINLKESQDESQTIARAQEEKIKQLEEQIDQFEMKITIAQKEKDWLRQYSSASLAFNDKVESLNIQQADKFMNFLAENQDRLDKEIAKLREEQEEITKHKKNLKLQKENTNVRLFEDRRQVTISLAAKGVGEITLGISYVIKGATWLSRYDVRVHSTENQCILTYLGTITNNTGEDWNNVQLTLSTVQPSLGGEPPKLFPLRVDIADNIIVPRVKPMRNRSLSITAFDEVGSPKAEKESILEEKSTLFSEVKTGATSVSYLIDRKAKIVSDNKPHKVPIAEIPVQVEFQYIVIPSKSPNAYLKAKTTNKSSFQLLEGEMNVFMDGFYITTSHLQKTAPGEEFKLYLGVDNAIKVDQKPVFKETTTVGLFNKKTIKTYQYLTEVTNNKSFEITLLAYHEYPFASDKENIKIKREIPPLNHTGVTIDSSSVLCWTVKLPPGKKEKVKLKYTVEHPEEKDIYFVKQDERAVNY